MIHLTNISKTFNRGSDLEVPALQNMHLEIPDHQFVVVVGSNGSGKTTLLNLLAGNIFPDSGSIVIDGIDVTSLREHQRSRWIARIFQNPQTGTAPDLTVIENFRLASIRTGPKRLKIGTTESFRKLVREKIAVLNLGLENKLMQLMGTLSGGQRQALSLLMAVMDNTKVLLLDEPSAALDPKTSVTLMDLAGRLIEEHKITAILVTHQMKDVVRFGDRVIQLEGGNIIRDLEGSDKEALRIEEVFGWFEEPVI